jgi:hypothetical protein
MSNPASAPGDPSRDGQGRFVPNNPGGPGNPFARQVALLRKALIAAVTPEDFTAIADKLKEKALAGDLAATKLLFSYVLGKPTIMPDPDEVEKEPLKEQEKLETALGRIFLPILRRGAFEAEEPTEPEPAPPAASGAPSSPTVNKPTSGASPTAPRPQPVPAAPASSGRSERQSPNAARSTNGAAAAGSTSRQGAGRGQPFDKLIDRLANEDTPLRLGCTQTGITIVSS